MALPPEYPTKQSDDFFTILGNQFKLIGISWNAFRLNFLTFVVIYLLPFVILSGAFLAWIPNNIMNPNGTFNEAVARDFLNDINGTAAIAAAIGLLIVGSVLGVANIAAQLQSVKGEKLSFTDAIERAWPLLPRVVGLILLALLVVMAWVLSFAIPGVGYLLLPIAVLFFVIASFFLSLTLYVLVDKNSGVIESLKGSFHLVKRNWKIILSYFALSMVISLPSNLLGQLGGFVSMVLSIAYLCLPALLYLRISRESSAKTANSAKLPN